MQISLFFDDMFFLMMFSDSCERAIQPPKGVMAHSLRMTASASYCLHKGYTFQTVPEVSPGEHHRPELDSVGVCLYFPFLSLSPVQCSEPTGLLGHVAPHPGGRGSVCHCKHLQFPAADLTVHREFAPGTAADLAGTDASGHPKIPVHILPRAARLCEWPKSAVLLL